MELILLGIIGGCVAAGVWLRTNYYRKKRENAGLQTITLAIQAEITELAAINQQLSATQGELRGANQTKDRFFSIISHDLKGPLNSLTGLLQILAKYVDSFSKQELRDFAQNMDKSVRNLVDLLDNLLRWSRTQTGHMPFRPQPVQLVRVVEDTVNLLSLAAANKQITLRVAVSDDEYAYADADMLSFVLRNLIWNAIKFTHQGGSVTVAVNEAGHALELAVTDTGIGMRAEDVHKLFKIDAYHSTNGTNNEMGTGLGLILCHEFVEKNGGRIFVESTLGEGTTFRFTVPRRVMAQLTT